MHCNHLRYINGAADHAAGYTTYCCMRPMVVNVYNCISLPEYWRHNVELFDDLAAATNSVATPTVVHDENSPTPVNTGVFIDYGIAYLKFYVIITIDVFHVAPKK